MVHLPNMSINVHTCYLCETVDSVVVLHRDLWSIGGGGVSLGYLCIHLYVKCSWCSGLP